MFELLSLSDWILPTVLRLKEEPGVFLVRSHGVTDLNRDLQEMEFSPPEEAASGE